MGILLSASCRAMRDADRHALAWATTDRCWISRSRSGVGGSVNWSKTSAGRSWPSPMGSLEKAERCSPRSAVSDWKGWSPSGWPATIDRGGGPRPGSRSNHRLRDTGIAAETRGRAGPYSKDSMNASHDAAGL